MKTTLLILGMALALSGCGGGDDDSSTPIPPDNGGGDIVTPDNLIEQCESQGCTLDEAVTTTQFTVTNAPITLTNNASITLE